VTLADLSGLAGVLMSIAALVTASIRGRGRLARIQESRDAREQKLADLVYTRLEGQISRLNEDVDRERRRRLELERELGEAHKRIRQLQDELTGVRRSVSEVTGNYPTRPDYAGN